MGIKKVSQAADKNNADENGHIQSLNRKKLCLIDFDSRQVKVQRQYDDGAMNKGLENVKIVPLFDFSKILVFGFFLALK